MIIDTPEYLADSLFIQEQVRVDFGKEYRKEDSAYVMIFCKIRKKDENKFLKALGRLENKMLLMGYRDYRNFCRDFFDGIEKDINSAAAV